MSFFIVSDDVVSCKEIEDYHQYCDAKSNDLLAELANAEKCASLRKAKRKCYKHPDGGHNEAIRNTVRHIENIKKELRRHNT